MQAMIRTVVRMAHAPVRLWNHLLGLILYQFFLRGMWWMFHLAFNLQKVEVTTESDELDLDRLTEVPRLYISWHARLLGAVPMLQVCHEMHAVSMPHRGWGNEGVFQRSLRSALFTNMHRKGFRFIELRHRESREKIVERIAERLKEGKLVLMTADSPKGGAFVAQLGGILAASQSGVELVPYSFSSSRKIRINPFWDNFMTPVPFGTFHLRLGTPMRFSPQMDEQALEQARQQLALSLNRLTLETDDRAGIRREYRLRAPEMTAREELRSPGLLESVRRSSR